MIRPFAVLVAVVVAVSFSTSCSTGVTPAEPDTSAESSTEPDASAERTETAEPSAVAAVDEVFAIGMCFDQANPLPQQPAVFDYNCDNTGVLQDMTWSSWDAEGARGTGMDNSVECQPNCAEGPRLLNPVVVHAWNPQPSASPNCPTEARFYTDMTIAYPEDVPPWITPGAEWTPGTDFVRVDGMPAVHYSGLTTTCEQHLR